MPSTWERIAPIIGLLSIAVIVAAFIISGETPDANASTDEVVSFYTDNDTETAVAGVMLAFASVLYALFYALVAARTRRAAGSVSALSFGIIAGGAMSAIGMAIFAGINLTLGDVGPDLEPAAVQTLNALNSDFYFPVAAGTAVLAWSLALGVLRGTGLPRWLGWAALVIAIASVTPAGFFAFLAILLWTLVASVVMLMQPEAA